jgi:hypothetical protein
MAIPESQPAKTYREIGRGENFEFAAILVAWWGGIIVVFSIVPDSINGGLAFGLMVALGGLAMLPLMFLSRWQRKRRVSRIKAALAREGFVFHDHPTEKERKAVLEEFCGLALLRNDSDYVDWIARKTIGARQVTILRHSHLDGSGDLAYDRTSTVVATRVRDARSGVWITRTNALTARRDSDAGYHQDFQIGDAWFDQNFRIQCQNPADVARLLTAPVKQYMATGPWKESWTIGWGYVLCIFGADTTADGIIVMIARVNAMIDLLQPDAG